VEWRFFSWMAAVPTQRGKRLGIFGKLGYNFGFNCKPILQLTVGNLAAAIFFTFFHQIQSWVVIPCLHSFIIVLHSWVINMYHVFS